MYICTLPTNESWIELQERIRYAGGAYLAHDVRRKDGAHIADHEACWKTFPTIQKRYEHQVDEHSAYLEGHEDEAWLWKKLERMNLA